MRELLRSRRTFFGWSPAGPVIMPVQRAQLGFRWSTTAAFAVVVLAALFLRVDALNWDDATYPHPDERFMTMVVAALHSGTLSLPGASDAERSAHRSQCLSRNGRGEGVGDWFDTSCSDFNPANVGYAAYPYGPLPPVVVRLAAEGWRAVSGDAGITQYGAIHRVGRLFSAACDLLTLLATFLLGRLLWDARTGLLAMAFYAFAVLPVQAAHFWTVDSSVTLFATVALIFLVRLSRFGLHADAAAFGVAAGLALACKISAAPLVLLLPLAVLLAPGRVAFARRPDAATRVAVLLPVVAIASAALLATYRIASPFAFTGPSWHDVGPEPAFVHQLNESIRLAAGNVDIPPNWQWLGRSRWLYAGRNLIAWGLGPALGLAALAGVVVCAARLLRWGPGRRARSRALIVLWAVGYFAWMGQQWVASMRYLLPIYPVLCLLAAAWLVPWWRARRIVDRGERTRVVHGPAAIAVAALAASALWALALHHVHTSLHPYVAATHWILRNVEGPVSATVRTAAGTTPLVNWPAAGDFGDAIAPAIAATTRAPASGSIERLRLHDVTAGVGGTTIGARILAADGSIVGEAPQMALPLGEQAPAGPSRGIDLPLAAPVQLVGGRLYRLQLRVHGGPVRIAGARIAQEGAWNDPVPMRVPWLPPTDGSSVATMPSGAATRGIDAVDPFAEHFYVPVDLRMADEDDAAKRERLVDALDRAEWLVVPNNRFFDSMTRNPLRFPLATRFYDALFSGTLGYSRVELVASLPRIFGIDIDDQAVPAMGRPITSRPWREWAAEEAFSVYDHPVVHIFRKNAATTRAALMHALDGLDLTDVGTALAAPRPTGAGRLTWSTREASVAPDGLSGRAANRHDERRFRIEHGHGDPSLVTQAGNVVAWYAASFLLGLLAWPWLACLWPAVPDRGYATARIAGIAMLALPAWWMGSAGIPTWSRGGLVALAAMFALASAGFAWRRFRPREIASSVVRWAVTMEALFLALFALGVALRMLNPDLWAPALGGEKPMDFALFRRVLVSEGFPPDDPWFSGGRLNYYYFGWVMSGALALLTNAAPAIAYNLALPTWLAMTGVGAAGLASNVCTAWGDSRLRRVSIIAGVVAMAAAVLLGNLDLPRALAPAATAVWKVLAADAPVAGKAVTAALTDNSERWFWAPTRTVGERVGSSFEVNEFPAFTFLLGDLHAHLLALPLQLFALSALFAIAASALARVPAADAAWWLRLLVLAIPVGLLRATNTWDWPLYLLLACAATAFATWRSADGHALHRHRVHPSTARSALAAAAVVVVLVVQWAIAWPFRSFVTGEVALHAFDGAFTPLASWLAMEGWFVIVLAGWTHVLSRDASHRVPPPSATARALPALRIARWSGLALVVVALVLHAWRGAGAVPALGAQVALVAWLAEALLRYARTNAERTGIGLALIGFCLSLGVEFVVIGRDIGRMNTFFKLHMQAWLLLSIASGIAIASLAARWRSARPAWPWRAVFAVATLVALAYLPLALVGRSHARFDAGARLSLDGEAFLAHAVYLFDGHPLRLAADKRIIEWMRANTGLDDVVLEAQLPEYRWGSRISVFTSRPTVLGYRFHESQQRPIAALGDAIELRRRNVEAIYASTDAWRAMTAVRHYGVRFIVVGALERAVYPAPGLAKFATLAQRGDLLVAFTSGDDVVYRVPGDDSRGPAPSW